MNNQPFSKKWVLISFIIYIVAELLIGALLGNIIVGSYISIQLRFMLQGLFNLISFFIGGIIIGLISPGIRIYEPAIGAFIAVALMIILSLFTPYSFIQFSLTKIFFGGGIAFILALTGARIGEKIMGNLK